MDSFELNKIIGAILGTLLFVMGVGFLAEAVYAPRENGPGLTLPEPEGTEHGGGETVEVAEVPIAVLLASADAGAGENSAKKCQSCHNFAAGAGNKTGPELYDVVERLIGGHPGFAYSAGMEAHKAAGDTWTYEHLNDFLISPKTYTPGTKMNFNGVKDDKERANIIAYLATLSASPKPFPAVEAAPAATEAAPAAEPVATDAGAVETPATTSTETPVEGTATGSDAPAGGMEAAPAAGH